jgi:hypothetical protein
VKLTILVPAGVPTPELATAATPRRFYRVDEFARAIGDALAIDVPIVEGKLADAPSDGYLLAFDLPITVDARDGTRIVAFGVDRATIMKRVEAQTLAAAVEKHRYFEWCTRRADERGDGLVGRKDVAARMHARILTGPYTSPHYAAIASSAAGDLPILLAAYLTAYPQVVNS